jgi:hypothetical protein
MRRDVRAIFIDEKERTARREAAPVRNGEVVQRNRDRQRDQHELEQTPTPLHILSAAFASSHKRSISSSSS